MGFQNIFSQIIQENKDIHQFFELRLSYERLESLKSQNIKDSIKTPIKLEILRKNKCLIAELLRKCYHCDFLYQEFISISDSSEVLYLIKSNTTVYNENDFKPWIHCIIFSKKEMFPISIESLCKQSFHSTSKEIKDLSELENYLKGIST